MSQREKRNLIFSIILSLIIWSFLFGPYIGFSLVYLLLVHEYGHYFWMGKEGITQRSMIMVPPLGAVAMAKEPWPSRLSEAKIAFAGPFFGLLSLLPLLWLLNTNPNNPQLRIIIYLGCYINLFNLLMPVAIMDGGRIIKSISFSINY